MSKKDETLKLALEAFEADASNENFLVLKHCVREALAENALDRMAENARELGLDYEPIVEQVEDSVGIGHGAWDMVEPKELAKAFHEALAEQPAQQQEPMPCVNGCQGFFKHSPQPSKPWVGLTDDEIDECYYWKDRQWTTDELVRHVEAKLREKNEHGEKNT